jgi:trehalose 6-phosphate synthase/phosphatase
MRLVIISNRAPINIVKTDNGYSYQESSGGLASGLRAYIERMKSKETGMEIVWIGWPGTTVDDEETVRREILEKHGVQSVFMSAEVMEKFYEGFCNKTIWPLFHYFPAFTFYENEFWQQYIYVNELFRDEVMKVYQPGDVVWVHDYHLMLLPAMIREKAPGATVGFFLHIPFPSYEVFRLLPSLWRKKILEGLFGADLIGFHTHEYCQYFLHSVLRILGYDQTMGEVLYHNRLVKVDTFPMGIDYNKYHARALTPEVKAEKEKLRQQLPNQQLILSIDRQDYSKGILNRLLGYEHFLANNASWRGKVTLMMIVIPSRIGVEDYQTIKSQIDELVGRINGKFSTLSWIPIMYHYHSISFDELIALYNISSVALVTPLRDGMNLIAKEFIASRTDISGVLILSEMAGSVDELAEAIIINPNNVEEISTSLLRALEMKEEDQESTILILQKRLKNYDVFRWAEDFLTTMDDVKKRQDKLSARKLSDAKKEKMAIEYRNADMRVLFLDYDGTLVPHTAHPRNAFPDKDVLGLLQKLSEQQQTRVVILSGRDKNTLQEWFGHLPIELSAEHGLFLKPKGGEWSMLKPARNEWKKDIMPILQRFTEKLFGSFVEEKEYSLVFHYRRSDPEFAAMRLKELMDYLANLTSKMDLQLVNGNKALEIRLSGVDKGMLVMHVLSEIKAEKLFALSIGDDETDEDMFRAMPPGAYSIKVGQQPSYALYNLATPAEVLRILNEFLGT